MNRHERVLEFQIKYGAVVLPYAHSHAFISNDRQNDLVVVWLPRETAEGLCEKALKRLKGDAHTAHVSRGEDYYRVDHPSNMERCASPPSLRVNLAYANYRNGELDFINGRHRTRLYLEAGALFVPFSINESSLRDLQNDGHNIATWETGANFAKRLIPMDYFAQNKDPLFAVYRKSCPKPMAMNDVLDMTRLFFKLSAFEIVCLEWLNRSLKGTNLEKQYKALLKDAYWYFDRFQIITPAIRSMKEQGLVNWPKNAGPLTTYPTPEVSPQEDAERWAKSLPVRVPLGEVRSKRFDSSALSKCSP